MEFRALMPSEKNSVMPFLEHSRFIDMGFSSLYSLKDSFFPEFCLQEDMLLIRMRYDGCKAYAHPLKDGLNAHELSNLINNIGEETIIFDYIPEDAVGLYQSITGYFAKITCFDKYSDYFADSEQFRDKNRPGHPRKYTDYRSFTTHFTADVRTVCRNNICDCIFLLDKWCSGRDCSLCAYGCEKKLQHALFDAWETLPAKGIIVYIDGKPQSYLIGEQNGDTALILYGKPVGRQNGLNVFTHISLIDKCFAEAKYVNFSPDSGMDGLKLFKSKFTPFRKLKKYYCVLTREGS